MSWLRNALESDEYAESLENDLVRPSWRDTLRPDRETEPPPVTLGDDGNYYANDNRWNYGEWVTYTGDEPVYWVNGGTEGYDEDRWDYDEYGNVVTKDADFAGDGHVAINPAGQWMTEQQIRDRWDSRYGMTNFKRANPDMSVDDYLGLMKETTALKAQGIEPLGEGGVTAEYQALYDKYGIQTKYKGKDGAIYEWNGSTYTNTVKGVDKNSQILHGLALGILGAGASVGLAGALAPTLGAAGAKSASSAIINLASQSLANGGKVDLTDALISAATAYGGAKLGELVAGSGAVSDAVGVAEELQNKFVERGLDYTTGKGKELYDKLLSQYELMNQAGDFVDKVGGPLSDIANSVWDAVNDDRSDDVDYGGTDADITGTGPDFGDDFGVEVDITPPEFPDPEVDPETDGGGSPDPDSGGGGDPEVDGDPDWRYENGVWTNGTDIINGPGTDGGTMTDEEMAEVWKTGDYTWGGDLGDGGSTDVGNTETDEQPAVTPIPNGNPNPNPDPDSGIDVPVTPLPPGPGGNGGGGNGDGEGDGDGDGKGKGDGNGNGEGGMFEPFKPTNTPMPVFTPWSKYRPSARPQLYRGLWSQLGLSDFKL